MVRAEPWRGSPTATTRTQLMRLVRILRPSKERDVFYDVGCGYARPCIWIAGRVKLAVGIENFEPRYREALRRVERSGLRNITILKRSLEKASYGDATMIYSVIALDFNFFRKVLAECMPGTVVALCYCPPYPMKSEKVGEYYLMRTPFERVKDEAEYAQIFTGRKKVTIEDVLDSLPRSQRKYLKWEISHADSNWKKLHFA